VESSRLGSGYTKLWAARAISNLGDGVSVAAVPLLAPSLTRDPAVFAGVTMTARLPWLMFSLAAGRVADTFDRKRLVAFVDVGRSLLSGVLGVAVLQGSVTIWHFYIAVFALGTGEVFAEVAAQVLMPAIVERSQLARANGRLFGAEIATNQFAGPFLGSWLFAVFAAARVLFDAGTFLAGALLILWIRVPRENAVTGRGEKRKPRVSEGLKLVWGNPLIRTLALLGSAMNAL
jgi:Transmembrane secretion effector